jgi:hypothetical protein
MTNLQGKGRKLASIETGWRLLDGGNWVEVA